MTPSALLKDDPDALRDSPLLSVGRPEKSENNVSIGNIKGGNNREYLLKRLARDDPKLLDAVESGKLSPRAAAIKAGIVKTIEPKVAALKLMKKLSPADRR